LFWLGGHLERGGRFFYVKILAVLKLYLYCTTKQTNQTMKLTKEQCRRLRFGAIQKQGYHSANDLLLRWVRIKTGATGAKAMQIVTNIHRTALMSPGV